MASGRVASVRAALRLVRESAPGWTIASGALTLVQGLLPVAALWLTKGLVDAVARGIGASHPDAALRDVLPWILLAAGVALLGAVLRPVASVVLEQQAARVTDHVTDLIHRRSSSVDLAYYEDPAFHDTLHRAQLESPYRPTRMVQALGRLVQNGLSLAGVAALLAVLHWGVAVLMAIAVLPGIAFKLRQARRLHAWRSAQAPTERRARDFHRLLTEAPFAKDVRMLDLGGFLRSRYREARETLRAESLRMAIARGGQDLAVQAGAVTSLFVLVAFVARQAIRGLLTLGDVAMYLQALSRCQAHLGEVLSALVTLNEDALFLSHLDAFLSLPPRMPVPDRPVRVPSPVRDGFRVEAVSFRYPGARRDVLDGATLTIRPGEIVALVGENGAGKSTLAKLLCRLHDPTAGRISIDGVDLRVLDPGELRRAVSVVFQDPARFPLSLLENVRVGDVRAGIAGGGDPTPDVVEAARRAGADRLVGRLQGGWDAILSPHVHGGVELSGGEWQQVALARAFFRGAQLLVLDEPGSALSPRAAAHVLRSIREGLGGRAVLVISHRRSTVRLADRICVLHDGRIVEEGSHDELQRLGGCYARLRGDHPEAPN